MSPIVVLGSANLDFVVSQARQPAPGETVAGTAFTTVPGGKGLNQAIAAARAGAEVVFLGAIGRDEFGVRLRSALEADGVDTSGLLEVEAPTGTAHIAVLDGGENAIVVVPGANAAVGTLTAGDRERIAGASHLLAQFERPPRLVAEAFALARVAGVTTVLTPAPVVPFDDALLDLVDVLVPNEHEARELTGLTDETAAVLTLSRRVKTVVMTRGSRGTLVARDGAIIADLDARAVHAVDTTGAGDTFVGVLVARLAAGSDLEQALGAARVAASIAVTRPGASSSMPTWAEIASLAP